MTHYRRQFRVPRKQVFRALFSKRGLVLTLLAEHDQYSFIATIVPAVSAGPATPPRLEPKWQDLDETAEGGWNW